MDEGKKSKKDKDENENDKAKGLHEYSMRQLRRQMKKALTLKNLNANENAATKVGIYFFSPSGLMFLMYLVFILKNSLFRPFKLDCVVG